ncbi:choline/carnitine O-acyltransferase [Sporosarcina sp. UB5]|uniref:choline/carnitine O-acyltransferase n=1 Tax=Sporosarcina sp. UB5 TaxID=3047463 RepID=UPI003D793366
MNNTFTFQHQLPSLPIPTLEETKTKLLEWIEPLVTDEQFEETTRIAEKFFSETGEARLLHEQLKEWDEQLPGSWLKPFWDEMYLAFRGSLPLEMNFSMLLDTDDVKNRYTVSSLVGKIGYSVTELYHLIVDEKVAPEMVKGIPLCMSQYKNLFKSIRIPRPGTDEYVVGEWTKANNYIVLVHRNHFYRLDVSDADGNQYSDEQLENAVESILTSSPEWGENVGIFTTAERETAANIYTDLSKSANHADNLKVIADALVVISLDETTKGDALESLFSNSLSRYYDKTIEIIVFENGEVGFNFEHTGIDGTTSLAIVNHVSEGLQREEAGAVNEIGEPNVAKLDWELTSEMKNVLRRLEEQFEQAKAEYDLNLLQFKEIGARDIKRLGISPDAFFHMALQIAQYRTFGAIRSTYEPVAVRFFNEGRTECARAASNEKSNLVIALERGDESNEALYELMKQASNAHSGRLKECQRGHGVERHLVGLQQMVKMYGERLGIREMPELFTDAGYVTLRHDFLSTSGMTIPNVKSWIFGPVVADGYGIGYSVVEDHISINVSSKMGNGENAKTFIQQVTIALNELKEIAESQLQASR